MKRVYLMVWCPCTITHLWPLIMSWKMNIWVPFASDYWVWHWSNQETRWKIIIIANCRPMSYANIIIILEELNPTTEMTIALIHRVWLIAFMMKWVFDQSNPIFILLKGIFYPSKQSNSFTTHIEVNRTGICPYWLDFVYYTSLHALEVRCRTPFAPPITALNHSKLPSPSCSLLPACIAVVSIAWAPSFNDHNSMYFRR